MIGDANKQALIRMARRSLAMNRVLSDDQLQAREMSLAQFVKESWHIIEPATRLIDSWTMAAICDHVQALLEGRLAKNNLAICVPPGFSKSTIVSVCAPAWWWITHPSWRGLFISGSERVRTRDSMKSRDVIDSEWYRQRFGVTWQLRDDANEKTLFRNSQTGFRQAATITQKITGDRASGIFVDDANDAADVYSKAARDEVNRQWDGTIANRLADMQMGTRCVIMQRLHEEDLIGHILEVEAANWELLRIPQLWDESLRVTTSLGWTDPRTVEGELAFEARFPQVVIDVEKVRLGPSFDGQHQQRPSSAEGELFKRGFAQFINPATIPDAAVSMTVASWDTAVKEKQSSDWSVSLIGVKFDRGVLIREQIRIKTGYSGLKEATKLQAARVRLAALLIEDKQTGQALIQELRDTTDLPIVAVQANIDKVTRAWPLVPYWEARRVFFPCDAMGNPEQWVEDFLAELYAFPKAAHDDRVDAFTQLLTYLNLSGGGAGLLRWYETQTALDAVTAQEPKRIRHFENHNLPIRSLG